MNIKQKLEPVINTFIKSLDYIKKEVEDKRHEIDKQLENTIKI